MCPPTDFIDPVINEETLGMRIVIHGSVQGVGFRPFTYRLAKSLGLRGWVRNSTEGVLINIEGSRKKLQEFILSMTHCKLPNCSIENINHTSIKPKGYSDFEIRSSVSLAEKSALVLPDISTCTDCLKEIFSPRNRRYLYPFTNCTNCGPRYSIIESLPYDRLNTTMKEFVMCCDCRTEYENPSDRRFHAETNCCPDCGPRLESWDRGGNFLYSDHEAVQFTSDSISRGAIAAVKGIGGFHLIVDARNDNSVNKLRRLKTREQKPFALIYPSLEHVKKECELSEIEENILISSESPIVLLKRIESEIAPSVAPGNPYLGVMLPYSPLHHILMAELNFPVVATSGNLSDEPICTEEDNAVQKLGGIAEYFLIHNRRIARHVDDSVVRVVGGRAQILRLGRGYSPLSFSLEKESSSILAVGSHLKNTIAVSRGKQVFLSQHIGDLQSSESYDSLRQTIKTFKSLYDLCPDTVSCDSHPYYLSTKFAERQNLPLVRVQHHYAHVLACMEEHKIQAPVLGVCWDGMGYGLDGTIWGGEFLKISEGSFNRVGHFRLFSLPGGDKAIREPRRAALGALYEIFHNSVFELKKLPTLSAFSSREVNLLHSMLRRKFNTPVTSSAGRLFDAVSSILGICQRNSFEGEAAMKLEYLTNNMKTNEAYECNLVKVLANGLSSFIVDWGPLIKGILRDINSRTSQEKISTKFHNTLSEIIVEAARYVGQEIVVLTGGCFQNKFLLERAIHLLKREGFSPYWPERIPPNDGGISAGQIIAASRILIKDYNDSEEGGSIDVFSGSREDTEYYGC